MKTMQEHIAELSLFFEFYNYVNQFSNEEIAFTFYKKTLPNQPFEVGISFDNKVKWITGKPESNTDLNRPMAEKFYRRLLQNSPHCKERFVEKHFIEENLAYLNSLPVEIKKEFRYIFNPLFELFEKAQQSGGLKTHTINLKSNKSYSLRQVCIAYHFMGNVTKGNAAKLLKLHTQHASVPKLLQKQVTKASELTTLSENKTTDTKHLTDLKEAKRLITGKKNKEALQRITHVITLFQANYNNHYL